MRWLGSLLLLISLVGVQSSRAELITFEIGGRFTEVEGLGLAVGNRFSAQYTFESTQADSVPGPGGGYTLTSYRLVVPALGLDVTGATGSIAVNNDIFGQDQYAVALDIAPAAIIIINDVALLDVQISLIDVTGTVFSDESLPLIPPPLSSFPDDPGIGNARSFVLRGNSLTSCSVICFNSGTIDTFSIVPAPSTPALLLAGFVVLIWTQRVRLRSRPKP